MRHILKADKRRKWRCPFHIPSWSRSRDWAVIIDLLQVAAITSLANDSNVNPEMTTIYMQYQRQTVKIKKHKVYTNGSKKHKTRVAVIDKVLSLLCESMELLSGLTVLNLSCPWQHLKLYVKWRL
ncbi:unnamed protein product [Timema podura]|uniref:Uncharacterized protein n=1 Tax=Timema podura TaxID=61482 RepID=A0ABN7NFJ3_TIMPD|nr:unnamed protein product [Timema podura]